jgi:glycosyltransferase involved in cell wall biosynthesis
MRTSVLVFLSHYLPGTKIGGPAVSIKNLVQNLCQYYDFKVLTLDRDLGDTKPYYGVKCDSWINLNNVPTYYNSKSKFRVLKLVSIINNSESDILYLNSLFDSSFTIPVLIFYRMGLLNSKKLILAPRGELFDEALNFSTYKKRFFLKVSSFFNLFKNVSFHATDVKEKEAIVKILKINESRIRTAMIISSVMDETFLPFPIERSNEVLTIVFLSRISKDKNILFIFKILANIEKNIIFDIYGPIEDLFVWKECLRLITLLPSNINCNYMGIAPKKDVKNIFYKYDLFFLPTLAENFGHAIAESLSVGTPVLISDSTPWRNLEIDGLGWDIPLVDINAFINVINELSNKNVDERELTRKNIREVIDFRLKDEGIIQENISLFE